jgi:hypothetical protein
LEARRELFVELKLEAKLAHGAGAVARSQATLFSMISGLAKTQRLKKVFE